ncbi:hypothetical protein ABBQ32_006751 [Trebouxia sp. C0010 RCD-2024]
MRTAVLCALLGLVCFASAARDMAPAPAPAPGPSAMLAPMVAPAGETAPAPAPMMAQLVCPCALEKGSYDVTAKNLADIIKSRADCPLDMTAGSGCPTGNYGFNNTGGCGNVGCNNSGTSNVGSNNSGSNNKGDNNDGSNNTGFCLSGSNESGDKCSMR